MIRVFWQCGRGFACTNGTGLHREYADAKACVHPVKPKRFAGTEGKLKRPA